MIKTDEQIIEMYWQRNEEAIRETDIKYGNYLFTAAYNILHDELDCEECKNDTYLGIWNRIPPTRPSEFRAFIIRIMRNIAIDKYKQKTSKKRIPSELTVSMDELIGTLTEPATEDSDALAALITGFLDSIDKRKRYIFIGKYYICDDVKKIAKELSLSVPTVYREIEKIKEGLRNHLKENGVYL